MSNRKNKPIIIEEDISVKMQDRKLMVTGPKGILSINLHDRVSINIQNNQINLGIKNKKDKRLQNLFYSLIMNALTGVKGGWSKTLDLVGVGFRANSQEGKLILNLGFSHPVVIPIPEGISFSCVENKFIVTGCDKYLVGKQAAKIRRLKPPEPYKGKGIRYQGEIIRRKLGKAAKAVGAIPGGK